MILDVKKDTELGRKRCLAYINACSDSESVVEEGTGIGKLQNSSQTQFYCSVKLYFEQIYATLNSVMLKKPFYKL